MVKYIPFVLIIAFISLIFTTCSSKNKDKIDPVSLYENFYTMNKNNNFEGLYNLDILGIRDRVEYNTANKKYLYIPSCIGIRDSSDNIITCLPSFSKNANIDEIKQFFGRIGKSDSIYLMDKYGKSSDPTFLFDNYVSEINSIYTEYSKIKIPIILPQENIKIRGYNDYIVFYLYENKDENILYRCYYLRDSTIVEKNNKIDFKYKTKIDNNWYHD